MNPGNFQYKAGQQIDTGKKWIDSDGVPHIVYRKMVSCGALPNNTTKNVAHGIETIDPDRYARLSGLYASDGTNVLVNHRDLTVQFDATNISLVTATNLSAFTASFVEIEYCLADEES